MVRKHLLRYRRRSASEKRQAVYRKYSSDFDAYYDLRTGRWLERKCGELHCYYCHNRPYRFPITSNKYR